MISLSTIFWVLTGVVVGGTHSIGLKHSSTHASEWVALIGILRLAMIGGLLTVAAILGYLLSAFVGWIVGFVATLIFVMMRMK